MGSGWAREDGRVSPYRILIHGGGPFAVGVELAEKLSTCRCRCPMEGCTVDNGHVGVSQLLVRELVAVMMGGIFVRSLLARVHGNESRSG